jgi:phage baseplate assembly protein W
MSVLGIDLLCHPDLGASGELVSGRALLGQDLANRFTTPRGGLFYAPGYGFDLRALLSETLTDTRLQSLPAEIAAEALKDERINAATVAVSLAGETLEVLIDLQDAQGPFRLVLAVSALSVALLRVE